MRKALGTVPEDTRANVEKKQARTYEELQAEAAEAEQVTALLHLKINASMAKQPCAGVAVVCLLENEPKA